MGGQVRWLLRNPKEIKEFMRDKHDAVWSGPDIRDRAHHHLRWLRWRDRTPWSDRTHLRAEARGVTKIIFGLGLALAAAGTAASA